MLLPIDIVLCTDTRGQIGCAVRHQSEDHPERHRSEDHPERHRSEDHPERHRSEDHPERHHLLYRVPMDLARFRGITAGGDVGADDARDNKQRVGAVLMGRRTWDSMGGRSLKGRLNVVLSRTMIDAGACSSREEVEAAVARAAARDDRSAPLRFRDARSAYEALARTDGVRALYAIGGGTLLRSIVACPVLSPLLRRVHWTRVLEHWTPVMETTGIGGGIATVDVATFDPATELLCGDREAWRDAVIERWPARARGRVLRLEARPGGGSPVESWVARDDLSLEFVTAELPAWRTTLGRAAGGLATCLASGAPAGAGVAAATAELQYLALLRRLVDAPRRASRNAITRSEFGSRITCDLSDGRVPLLTTKRMAWRTVLRELLWFVRGETDNAVLQAQKVNIWTANASRAFLDARGLTEREEGDLGPIYGFQWRRFGARYRGCRAKYAPGEGVDQLTACAEQLRTDPHSRRILFTAWNPSDLEQMALPPCHVLGQFYVREGRRLWLQVYQRSGDVFLGVPFNLFSYSALVHMMARMTDLLPGGFVHVLGDAHLYETHIDAAREQLLRCPYAPPRLVVRNVCKPGTVGGTASGEEAPRWEDFQESHFDLREYACHAPLRCAMLA